MALKTNLVSYWKMEEASGSRVDVHGSNDLTDNNTVLNATGISGNGADHERDTSEWLSIAHASQTNLDVTTGDFSISCWIKRESTGIFGGLVGKIDSGDVGGYRLVFNSDNKLGFFIAETGGGTGSTDVASTNTFASTTVWYHVVAVLSGLNMTLYVNNVSEGTGSKASDYSLTNTEAFGTGRYRSGGDANYFDGIIDEVAFWNRAITTDEISEIYNSGTGKFYNDWDLVTFIPFIMMS